jgi:hypothetical protein
MLMVAEEARKKGIDREVALQAQGGDGDSHPQPGAKGKGILVATEPGILVGAPPPSQGDWRGSDDLAPVTLQAARGIRGGRCIARLHSCSG